MTRKVIVGWGMAVIFVLAVAAHILFRDPAAFPYLRSLSALPISILTLTATLFVTRMYGWHNAHGKAFALLSFGLLCVILGTTTQSVSLLRLADVSPALANNFYLLGYFIIFPALAIEFFLQGPNWKRINRAFLLWSFLFLCIAGGVLGYVAFSAYNPSLPLQGNLAAVVYPFFDFNLALLTVFTLKLVREYRGGALASGWMFFAFAIGTFLVGDTFFALYSDEFLRGIWPYTMINVLWLAGYLFAAYGSFTIGNALHLAQQRLRRLS